ncbi:GDP-fucose protein O-fucosyltransferase 2 [Trichinella nelsoni]|uniref:GDP-fucose protein O-fucosyltransferase 2 n=1 Tax=Trichinella nelsoni TaxID=6336 RepID=A0A0V0RXX4_9BILA|nr:GDP-fucose protein O-fucosyltransferase 2 [Trichinella nelsoni]
MHTVNCINKLPLKTKTESPYGTTTTYHIMLFSIFLLLHFHLCFSNQESVSNFETENFTLVKSSRYLHYDVNPAEGQNLRRDVYIRVASMVHYLREKGHDFVLVLPPWGSSIHHRSHQLGYQHRIPWKLWFDLESLNRFIPVIELEDYFRETGRTSIDVVEGKFKYSFWGYPEVYAKNVSCLSLQGYVSDVANLIINDTDPTKIQSIMIDRAEVMLHDGFGNNIHWKASCFIIALCRRSMRYSAAIRKAADDFRREELNSDDVTDKTEILDDWTLMKVKPGQAVGGPYLAVHLRRRDFVTSRSKQIPTVKGAAEQISKLLKMLKLEVVYVSTDAPETEVDELKAFLNETAVIKRFKPTDAQLQKFLDGGVATIEQWICAHAKYFIGTAESTFSFRIQEDREILGFSHNTTFNCLCPDHNLNCEQPAKWYMKQKCDINVLAVVLRSNCSVNCYKTHKDIGCEKLGKDESRKLINDENTTESDPLCSYLSEDMVLPNKLLMLNKSESLKKLLRSDHLRNLLRWINSHSQPSEAIRIAMKNLEFQRFAAVCLNIVEPENHEWANEYVKKMKLLEYSATELLLQALKDSDCT